MRLTVIICAYNSEKTLVRCLDSVCGQTYKELEILMIDDGSKDSTLSIMNSYAEKDSRITVISQKNMGAGLAKNEGLRHATGDYVTFVDSDDWITLDAFEKIATRIRETECDMLIYNHRKVIGDKVGRPERPIKDEIIDLNKMGRDTYIIRYLISYNHDLGACNKVIKNSILQKYHIGFSDNRKTVYDDNLYSLKLVSHTRYIATMSDAFYYYYINDNSITDMKNTYNRLANGYTNLFRQYIQYLKDNDLYNEIKTALPLLYYSMVYFGLIRLKHFGHYKLLDSIQVLPQLKEYREFMRDIGKFSVRFRLITDTMPQIYLLKNWPLSGLILLTLVQGKVVSYYALKDKPERIEKFL